MDEIEWRDPAKKLWPSIPGAHIPPSEPLYERGLLEDLETEAYGKHLSALTEKGRRVGRVF